MTKAEMRRPCTACKHFRRDWGMVVLAVLCAVVIVGLPLVPRLWYCSKRFAKCNKTARLEAYREETLVTNRYHRPRKYLHFCTTERAFFGDCKAEGLLFEERK